MENGTQVELIEEQAIESHAIDNIAVFDRIQTAMKVFDIKAIDITDALGIHNSSFSKWKAGKFASYIKHIDAIAEIIGVKAEYLLYGMQDEIPDTEHIFVALDEEGIVPKDMAGLLSITPTGVYNWRARNYIPAKHIEEVLCILNSTRQLGSAPVQENDKEGILEALNQQNISKASLAKHLGISRATVYRWKEDQAIPDKYIDKILTFLQDGPEQVEPEQAVIEKEVEDIQPEMPVELDEETSSASDITDEDITSMDNMDIADFIAGIGSFVEEEMQDLSNEERQSCLSELDMVIRLSLKRIKLYAKAYSALGV